MRNLPTLPACGQPATIRIEIYSSGPAGNAYGSLDAVAYGCDVHQRAIVTMLDDAGLTPFRQPYEQLPGEAVAAVCGTLRRFTTPVEPAGDTDHNGDESAVAAYVAAMHVPEPAIVQHPHWCQRTERPGRPHLSRPVHVRPDAEDGPRVALFVQQTRHTDDTAPQLVVQFDDGTLTEYVITLGHGKRVAREIRDLVALAGGGR